MIFSLAAVSSAGSGCWRRLRLDLWLGPAITGSAARLARHAGRCALAQPCGLVQQHAQALRCWLSPCSAYSFASMPFGNCTRKHSMPISISSSASFARGFVARVVAVVCDVHALGAVLLEGRAMIGSEAVHAVAGRHVADSPQPRTSARRSALRTG